MGTHAVAPANRTGRAGVVLSVLLLASCGPIPVQRAERECLEQARAATAPRGKIWVGGNSAGRTGGGVEVTISSDYVLGRDPSQVFDACVMRRSGQRPSRPLIEQPDWTG